MRDDTWWAAAHVLATLSHVVLGLAGAVYFVAISPFPGDGGPQFGDRFEYIRKFWLAIPMGMLGAMMNGVYFRRLLKLKQPTALDFPRELYHKRQITLLGGVLVLVLSCAGDLGLAANHNAAHRKTGYSSFVTIRNLAIGACFLVVLSFVADIIKYYSQWRPDMKDALRLEENQEEGQDDEFLADEGRFGPARDSIRLGLETEH